MCFEFHVSQFTGCRLLMIVVRDASFGGVVEEEFEGGGAGGGDLV